MIILKPFVKQESNLSLSQTRLFYKGKYAHLFEDEGCRIIGQKAFIRHEKRSTGIENINAVGTLITILDENKKVVDSDD